jgi:hypothetical protein
LWGKGGRFSLRGDLDLQPRITDSNEVPMPERCTLHLFGTIVEKRPVEATTINKNEPRLRLLNSKVNARNTYILQNEISRLPASDSEAGGGGL